jgi:hypothetical protein
MARFGRLADARIPRYFRTARLAFTRRIPGLKGETWGTLRVFSLHWRGGLMTQAGAGLSRGVRNLLRECFDCSEADTRSYSCVKMRYAGGAIVHK